MTIELKNIERVRVIVESTFKADATSSPGLGSFQDVPANEGTMQLTINTAEIDPSYVVQKRLGSRTMVLGPRTAQLKFTMNLAPTGLAAGASTAAQTSALTTLLGAVFGGAHSGTGTTFSAGWTAITGAVASAAGLAIGDFIVWVNTAGRPEARQIKNISGSTVTLMHGFSGAPATNDVCYAGTTCYPTEDPATSLQFLCSGSGTNDRWLLLGCQATGMDLAVDPTGKGCPTVTFTFDATLYKMSSETAGTVTGAIGNAAFSHYSPIVDYQSDLRLDVVGSPTFSTAHSIAVSALAFKIATSFVHVTNPASGYDGGAPVLRWRAQRQPKPCEVTITTYLTDLSYWTARDAKTLYSVVYAIGSAPGSIIVIAAPATQPLNPQRAASDQDIQGVTLNLHALGPNTDTSGTTDEAVAPYVIALL